MRRRVKEKAGLKQSIRKMPDYTEVKLWKIKFLLLVKKFRKENKDKIPAINVINEIFKDFVNEKIYPELTYREKFEKYKEIYLFEGKKTENPEYFKLRYGEKLAEEKLARKSERVKGTNNPAYDHGGKFSPLSKNFIRQLRSCLSIDCFLF